MPPARGDQSISLQARFIAQIIIVGAQVVGRAFTQALRQEFQTRGIQSMESIIDDNRYQSIPIDIN